MSNVVALNARRVASPSIGAQDVLPRVISRLKELRVEATRCPGPGSQSRMRTGGLGEHGMCSARLSDLTVYFFRNASGDYFSVWDCQENRLMTGYYDATGPSYLLGGREISAAAQTMDGVHIIFWRRGRWEERFCDDRAEAAVHLSS